MIASPPMVCYHPRMRIHHEPHKEGDTRVVRRFLIVPLTLGDETRFLEWARIVQRYVAVHDPLEAPYLWRDENWYYDELAL